jgi:hypothetical protein
MIKRLLVGSAIAAAGYAGYMSARRWYETWGMDPDETAKALPGDDLIPEPTTVDTRGITIDAPVEAVWPWLVQMGYGRGGWYSYDAMDMKGMSAEAILPELQSLAVGDTVPTDPGGGFVVKVIEREHALVLYVDPEIVAARTGGRLTVGEARGVAMSGRFLGTATPPRFSAAWAFVLAPLGGGRTRLLERFRARTEATSPGSQLFGPILGFGVFVMTQRQMLGIRARAERLARDRAALHRDVDAVAEKALSAPAETGATAG